MATALQPMVWNGSSGSPLILAQVDDTRPEMRRNRILNSAFETGIANWTKGANVTIAQSTVWKRSGAYSLALTRSTTTVGSGYISATITGLPISQQVTFSAHLYGGVGSYSLMLGNAAFNPDPKVDFIAPGTGNAAGVRQYITDITDAAGSLTVYVHDDVNTAPTIGTVLYIDDIMLEYGPLGTFFNGDTPDADGFSYEWTGLPHASASIMRDQRLAAYVV